MEALLMAIEALKEVKSPLVIAIDGPCGSGKSTLANKLKDTLPSCEIIHTDDFFLQPEQRSKERLSAPGGNMDRERLTKEVLGQVKQGEDLVYHRYNCQTGQMSEETLKKAAVIVVEGSYSQHPDLLPHYDLTVFLRVDEEEQLKRLLLRVGADRLKRFVSEWIPMENKYFETFSVEEHADIVL